MLETIITKCSILDVATALVKPLSPPWVEAWKIDSIGFDDDVDDDNNQLWYGLTTKDV